MTVHPLSLVRDERGSILPLAAGFIALVLVAVLAFVNAASLYQAQQRLQGVADAAALAAGDGFTIQLADGVTVARLDGGRIVAQASAVVGLGDATLVSASTPDGVSTRVRVSTTWVPVAVGLFLPDGFTLYATATSRTALH